MKNDNLTWVFSGGSWYDVALIARVADRCWSIPSIRDDYLGFRLSRVVDPIEQLSEVIIEKR